MAVDAFIAGSAAREHLAALLTAVERALVAHERKVVIVAPDSTGVAHWIAAVSYLLPTELARGMSFATYEHTPRYSRFDVVGTVPDADVDRADSAFDAQFLFDLTAGRRSKLTVHPLARLLTDVGVRGAGQVWRKARELATGDEMTFDDWQPAVVAATLLDGQRVAVDVEALPAWLATNAGRLGRPAVERIGAAVMERVDREHAAKGLPLVADAARTAGADILVQQIERAWADLVVDELVADGTVPPPDGLEIRTPSGRDHAELSVDRGLYKAAGRATPSATIGLLEWADRSGIPLRDEALHSAGFHAVGPELLRRPDDARLLALVRTWPTLRTGLVEHLGLVSARDPARVLHVWLAGLGDVIGTLTRATPELVEIAETAGARSGRTPVTTALGRIAESRSVAGRQLDRSLLDRLWPDRAWTPAEAATVLDVVEPKLVISGPMLDRLGAALRAGPPSDGRPDDATYEQLCETVREHPAYDRLPRATQDQIRLQIEAADLIDRLIAARSEATFDEILDEAAELCRRRGKAPRAVQQRFRERYRELVVGRLAKVLVVSAVLRDCVLEAAEPALQPAGPRAEVAAELLAAVWALKPRQDEPAVNRAQKVVADSVLARLRRWRRRDLDKAQKLLNEKSGQVAAQWFTNWRKQYAGNRVIRFVRNNLTASAPAPEPTPAPAKKSRKTPKDERGKARK